MAAASGVTIAIDTTALPLLEGAVALAAANIPGGNKTNAAHFGPRVRIGPNVTPAMRLVAFDPQTSGGLFLAVDPGRHGARAGQANRRWRHDFGRRPRRAIRPRRGPHSARLNRPGNLARHAGRMV